MIETTSLKELERDVGIAVQQYITHIIGSGKEIIGTSSVVSEPLNINDNVLYGAYTALITNMKGIQLTVKLSNRLSNKLKGISKALEDNNYVCRMNIDCNCRIMKRIAVEGQDGIFTFGGIGKYDVTNIQIYSINSFMVGENSFKNKRSIQTNLDTLNEEIKEPILDNLEENFYFRPARTHIKAGENIITAKTENIIQTTLSDLKRSKGRLEDIKSNVFLQKLKQVEISRDETDVETIHYKHVIPKLLTIIEDIKDALALPSNLSVYISNMDSNKIKQLIKQQIFIHEMHLKDTYTNSKGIHMRLESIQHLSEDDMTNIMHQCIKDMESYIEDANLLIETCENTLRHYIL
ncbi:hypothetical protein MTQ93_09675 [Staphylococcus agnetis]|uniref:hypothetical protein n=1 Tax=Staphylococcus agnetis TaxID=985762 RepID=UPI00208FA490|nr:hypothetical protein [Staphylococcus agnetis]MCO4346313.1 hypothetical protein [Staphylococcus agnetis]MCO4360611.1 hypothetical protein [Staphylococcus agnetis]